MHNETDRLQVFILIYIHDQPSVSHNHIKAASATRPLFLASQEITQSLSQPFYNPAVLVSMDHTEEKEMKPMHVSEAGLQK